MCVRGYDSSKKAEGRVKTNGRNLAHALASGHNKPLKKRLLRPWNHGVSIVKNIYVFRVITLRNDSIFSFLG